MSAKLHQEMPPQGGYGGIEWAKKIPRRGWSGLAMFGGFCAITGYGVVGYYFHSKKVRAFLLEDNDAKNAMEPLLLAEKERMYLKQLRRNFEEEKELMKNVPGWIPGTLWGEPVYYNRYDRWIFPSAMEFYAHTSPGDYYDRATEHLWH